MVCPCVLAEEVGKSLVIEGDSEIIVWVLLGPSSWISKSPMMVVEHQVEKSLSQGRENQRTEGS